MALIQNGGICAVDISPAGNRFGTWRYGTAIQLGYSMNHIRIAFSDGTTMCVPRDRVREDERWNGGGETRPPAHMAGELTVTFDYERPIDHVDPDIQLGHTITLISRLWDEVSDTAFFDVDEVRLENETRLIATVHAQFLKELNPNQSQRTLAPLLEQIAAKLPEGNDDEADGQIVAAVAGRICRPSELPTPTLA